MKLYLTIILCAVLSTVILGTGIFFGTTKVQSDIFTQINPDPTLLKLNTLCFANTGSTGWTVLVATATSTTGTFSCNKSN